MQRLVYSPSVKVWVKTDSGVIDLSPYVVDCNVDRKINDLSKAEVKFRNPKVVQGGKSRFMFTEHFQDGKVLPVFHPMDPITITFERIAGRPIQVFTGYCDSTPDVQLFPGVAKLTASCTLKRLNYTYWDPALPFVQDFMKNYGWQVNQQTGQAGTDPATNPNTNAILKNKTSNLNDSSIGNLVYAVLNEIGGWDPSNIYIQPLPKNIVSRVTNLFEEFTKDNKSQIDEVKKLLKDIVGHGQYGNGVVGNLGAANATSAATPSSGGNGWVTVEASWFDDAPPGASGKLGNAPGGLMNYAELGTAVGNTATGSGYMAKAFGLNGELPFYTKVEVRYKGKSIIASKTDRGYGSGSSRRAIDLWTDAADALGFKDAGIADVEIRRVP